MPTRRILDKLTARSFKPAEGGYLLQTSHPWLVGKGPRYIVTEGQKDLLMAVIRPRHPLLLVALIFTAVLALTEAPVLVAALTSHQRTLLDDLAANIASMLLVYATLVVMIRARLRRMAPILANAMPADGGIRG